MGRIKQIDFPERDIDGKYKLAIWTNRADFLDKDEPVPDLDKLLEIRAFDGTEEIRCYRSYVGEDFYVRIISDETERAEKDYGGCFDRAQFLDIDDKRSANAEKGTVYAIGGGSYHLPEPDAQKLMVRYYFKYDPDGVAYLYDKRLVGFLPQKGRLNADAEEGTDNAV